MAKSRFGWKHYLFEFITVFVGVTMAFALSTWNDGRKNAVAERDIILELQEGLQRDRRDITENMQGHEHGLRACALFRNWVNGDSISSDSLEGFYHVLLRDYISVQNKTAYEVIKSKGLELISDDSLRIGIVKLYDFDFEIIEKLEEDYRAMQYYDQYVDDIDRIMLPFIQMDGSGAMKQISKPDGLTASDKKKLLLILRRIYANRSMMVQLYQSAINRMDYLEFKLESITDTSD